MYKANRSLLLVRFLVPSSHYRVILPAETQRDWCQPLLTKGFGRLTHAMGTYSSITSSSSFHFIVSSVTRLTIWRHHIPITVTSTAVASMTGNLFHPILDCRLLSLPSLQPYLLQHHSSLLQTIRLCGPSTLCSCFPNFVSSTTRNSIQDF